MQFKYNPFRPNTLIHPGIFRGRASELLEIEKILFQTKFGNPQHFLVEGERGIGKSSLMLYVDHVARGLLPFTHNTQVKSNFVVVDLELTPAMQSLDIVIALAKRIRETIDQHEQLKSSAKKAWEFLANWEILGVKYRKFGSEDYRTMLRFMAEHSDAWVSRAQIIKASKLKEHTVDNALAALKTKNIIVTSEYEKGTYRLPTKSFAAWIRALSHAPKKH